MKWKYSDFDKGPELSPDLEWMVQSGQVSRQVFTETLVRTYYASIYRLALSLLNDLSAAQVACREVFSQAILNTHQYRSEVGIDTWINQVAYRVIKIAMRRERFWRGVEKLMGSRGQFTNTLSHTPQSEADRLIWQQVDQLPEAERIPFLLYFANGWQLEQIASALEMTPEQVRECVQRSLEGFAHLGEDSPPNIETGLRASLQRRWSLPEIAEDEMQHFSHTLQRRTGQRGVLRRGAATTREVVLLGIALVIVILAIWGGNRYFLQAESDASSGSYQNIGGLGVIQSWMESSMTLVGSGQAAGGEESESAKDEQISMRSSLAHDGSLGPNLGRCRSQELYDMSVVRYSAFKNKDRIRRFRLSQPPENAATLPGESTGESSLIPSYFEQLEPR